MRYKLFLKLSLLFLTCSLILPAFSQQQNQETITITTYYPAPFGVYRQLVTQTLGVGDNNTDGAIGGNDAPDPATDPGEVWISGNVGIGTTNPQGELHIRSTDNTNGNANLIIEGENPANGASTGSWDINSRGGTPGTPPAGNLQFNSTDTATPVNTTTPMTIEQGAPNDSLYVADNGNVGMGTNDPRARLDVNGGVRIGQDTATPCIPGTVHYNSGQLQVCNDTSNWVAVGGASCRVVAMPYAKVKAKERKQALCGTDETAIGGGVYWWDEQEAPPVDRPYCISGSGYKYDSATKKLVADGSCGTDDKPVGWEISADLSAEKGLTVYAVCCK
ncbi:MAG: hypothetical protein Q8O30_01705 [Candidatus Omnitrophota bacterium]|nr:hypothetical protein [Candidatus Omnitrophota bacterium]